VYYENNKELVIERVKNTIKTTTTTNPEEKTI